jgi:pyridoxal phosphate enzyme (YggS family)
MTIRENIARVRKRIQAAASRARRDPKKIELMAVSKTVSAASIREAYEEDIRLFGENRVQEFTAKAAALRELTQARWHMIGHLQTNKAGSAIALFAGVDSIDSLRLARKLNAAAMQAEKKLPVLIEINIGGEQAKSGVALDSEELNQLLSIAPELTNLEIRGLMALPPYSDDPEQSRPYFRRMREKFDAISNQRLPAVRMDVLSIGMSHDFEIAIEEGATRVRVGTAIFGERKSVRSTA